MHNIVANNYFGEVGGIAIGSNYVVGNTMTAVTTVGSIYSTITLSVPARPLVLGAAAAASALRTRPAPYRIESHRISRDRRHPRDPANAAM